MIAHLKVNERDPGLVPAELESLKDRLQCGLPADYERFLKEADGVYLKFNSFAFDGLFGPDKTDLQLMYSVRRPDRSSGLEMKQKVFLHRIPEDVLAVGTDSGGNQICLVVRGDRYGQIFLWEHEYEEESPEDPWHNMRYIAASLQDFFKKLEFD